DQSIIAGGCLPSVDCPAEQVTQYAASPNIFDLLGVRPAIGRSFVKSDGADSPSRVAVLSHPFWQRRFGGDSAVIGRTISLGGFQRTVIGVLPADVRFPDAPVAFLSRRPDVWT